MQIVILRAKIWRCYEVFINYFGQRYKSSLAIRWIACCALTLLMAVASEGGTDDAKRRGDAFARPFSAHLARLLKEDDNDFLVYLCKSSGKLLRLQRDAYALSSCV
ncbi:hypothetical protein RIF29_38725 [Crotalaria pallida]|uniref:Uncharacterized protein n=1 Tax=Crotalaria pallida TaxID=3830 RepID=A0AAN9E2C6_CROPI